MFESWMRGRTLRPARRLRRGRFYTGLAMPHARSRCRSSRRDLQRHANAAADPLPIVREDEIGRFWLHNSWMPAVQLHEVFAVVLVQREARAIGRWSERACGTVSSRECGTGDIDRAGEITVR